MIYLQNKIFIQFRQFFHLKSFSCAHTRKKHYTYAHMILLVGASASGKTEIAKKLGLLFGIKKVVTHTTRPPRPNETNHVDYHFVTKAEFIHLKEMDAFVETTFYNGNYYGCSKAEINKDKVIVVDPIGLSSFLALKDSSIVTFFLTCDETIRFERMKNRGDSNESVSQRINNDREDFGNPVLKKADYRIDTSYASIDDLARQIHELYLQEYAKRRLSL